MIGPILFLILQSISINQLTDEGNIVLGLYIWIIYWWITKPIPWSITSLLPLVVLPLYNMVVIKDVASLYGQPVLFFLMGVLLLGQAVKKHGLGKRIALNFLTIDWVSKSIYRILFAFLAVIALISAFMDDAATIAMGVPIALSIIDYIKEYMIKSGKSVNLNNLKNFMILGVLYASEAGGIMTVAGIPHIAVSISILEQVTGYTMTFLQWSSKAVIIGIGSFILYFLVLKFLFPPEISTIPDAKNYFKNEKQKMGSLSSGEINILIVLLIMIVLWLLPSTLPNISIWIVPVIASVLLFLLPCKEQKEGYILSISDFQSLPWDLIFLVLCGGVMASVTMKFGVVEWLQTLIPSGMNKLEIFTLSGFTTAVTSNLISGTATVNLMGNLLMPMAVAAGVSPITLAYLLPATGMAIMFPWAGAATGSLFGLGNIKIKDMIKSGVIATILHIILVIVIIYFFI